MKTPLINNILNSQPILIKFARKLFACKCMSFQTHLVLERRFSLIIYSHLRECGLFVNMYIYFTDNKKNSKNCC